MNDSDIIFDTVDPILNRIHNLVEKEKIYYRLLELIGEVRTHIKWDTKPDFMPEDEGNYMDFIYRRLHEVVGDLEL